MESHWWQLSVMFFGICSLQPLTQHRQAEARALRTFVLLNCSAVVLGMPMTFNWKEFEQLDQVQRSLFWEVTLDACRFLVSLGLVVPKPVLIKQPKNE